MKVDYNERNFEIVRFNDWYNEPSSLQQSSLADDDIPGHSAIWLGVNENRMHLSRELLQELMPHLNSWLETGSFCIQEPNNEPAAQPLTQAARALPQMPPKCSKCPFDDVTLCQSERNSLACHGRLWRHFVHP